MGVLCREGVFGLLIVGRNVFLWRVVSIRLSYSIVDVLKLWRVGIESCGESILNELIFVESLVNSLKDLFFGFLWRLELDLLVVEICRVNYLE